MDAHRVSAGNTGSLSSCGCLELHHCLKWKLCKWKVLLVTAETFQRVPFRAGRCPNSSNYCTPAIQMTPIPQNVRFPLWYAGFPCRTKRIWQTGAGLEWRGSDLHENDFLSTYLLTDVCKQVKTLFHYESKVHKENEVRNNKRRSGRYGGTNQNKRNIYWYSKWSQDLSHLILFPQKMQHDIHGELQLDENISMIIAWVLQCPLSSILAIFSIFKCIRYDIAFNSSNRKERQFWKVYIADISALCTWNTWFMILEYPIFLHYCFLKATTVWLCTL